MLLSAVSVLVVAQSSSEMPEGLMNNPVYKGFQESEAPRISGQTAYEGGKLVIPVRRPHLPLRVYPATHFSPRPSRPKSHSAAGRIKSTKSHNDPIGNRNRNLPACTVVPQLTAPQRTPKCKSVKLNCYL